MRKLKSIISCLLVCAILLGASPSLALAASAFPSETDPFATNYFVEPIHQDRPFFDVVLPEIKANIKENNTHSISKYYDAFPRANNPENFQGLGSTTYANINGKTVTAEAFYRVRNESLSDPNNGMGLMIYQCIQYKRAHPEEDVKITFSSYRTSVTASVCVLPESKYYGYMRSLYGTNYDEHGFVRISYMLTEAARMGIEVTLVNQLPSYAVWQYNPNTGKLTSRKHLNFKTYFDQALKSDCYESYAPGKKVSDFMNCANVDWQVGDKTNDMQHVKSASVSHYLATDGTEHTSAVFFSSANLDENSYIGANGNNGSQSGVIVSDHDDLYRVTYNYMQLMARHKAQEDLFELRKLVNEMNVEQAALIRSGRGDEIPADEQIIYLGSETDPVFELYYTPFGGAADTWDTELNPFCKYLDKLPDSTDYVELIWNEFGYGKCHIGEVFSDKLEAAFCKNPNPNNKISLRVTGFDTDAIQRLQVGTEIGYRSIKDGTHIHSKDILMSYEEQGVRHNVSLLTSCNFYMTAFNYRTNSLLVINETEESGGDFYHIMGQKYSYNMFDSELRLDPAYLVMEPGQSLALNPIYSGNGDLEWKCSNKSVATVDANGVITAKSKLNKPATITVTDGVRTATGKVTVVDCVDCVYADPGLSCSLNEQYLTKKKIGTFPRTFEASFTVDKGALTGTTTLFGNDGSFDPAFTFTLNKAGQPRVTIRSAADYSIQNTYVFNRVNVATGEPVHLTISFNFPKNKMHCYVNGEMVQTIGGIQDAPVFEEKHQTVVGGDLLNGNATYFPGVIHSVAAWSDLRISKDVAADYANGIDYTDENLLVAYDLTGCDQCMVKDLSANKNNLKRVVLWQDKEDVAPLPDYEYSFAVIGDTQTMCEKDPAAMESIYDWILENEKEQKIEYVIGLGDITDDSTDIEWQNASAFISKLNGKIPYVLTRGNHDDWDDFNRNLHNGFYENTVDGLMNSGDIDLSDPDQPGVAETVGPDGLPMWITGEGDTPEGGIVQGDLTNSYRYFSVQGTDYLILTLDFAPTEATLNWANKVIAAHPDHKVIAITHAYMYRDGTTIDAGDCYPPTYYGYKGYEDMQNGNDMWEKCFSKHENVLMVLSGHDPWQHVVYRQDQGVNDNTVTQMLIDPQYVDLKIGSTAMVAMLYFSNDGKNLTVRYYSVAKDCYGSAQSQFTISLDNHKHTYDNSCDTTCNVCEEKRTITHKYGKYVYNNDASEINNGTKTRTCSVCGKKDSVVVEGTKVVPLVDSSAIYGDVKKDSWYKSYIDYAVTFGIMQGNSNGEMKPDDTTTRAEFVQVLANLSGVNVSNRNVTTPFKDVPKGKWYTPAVKWAYENNIVNGVSDTTFAPNEKITREQMCTMLVRWAENYKKLSLKKTIAKKKFADDAKISSWAKDAVYKCQRSKLVNGVTTTTFAPQSNATRAAVATIITRFHEQYLK